MSRSLRAAIEINARWLECLSNTKVDLATCPNNETVAAIIDRHFPQPQPGE